MPLRCLLVDDSAAFLKAARALLEMQGLEVVGVASTSADALRAVQDVSPDVVLVDIDLGPESGFDLARRLREVAGLAPSQVILISAHDEADFADLIAENPVAGFVGKSDLSAAAVHGLLARGGDPA